MARILKVVYGGLTIGKDQSGTALNLTGVYRTELTYESFRIDFTVEVAHAVRATFLTAEASLVEALTTPDSTLLVELSGTGRHSFDPAANTGFLGRGSARKVHGTGNSAEYACSVVMQLPADLAGRSGRRNGRIRVTASSSARRRAVFTGEYTALSTNSARVQYASAVQTWIDGELTALTGEWSDRTSEEVFDYDEQNKILAFQRVFEVVIFAESQGATEVAKLVGQNLIVRRTTVGADSHPSFRARALVAMSATYSVSVPYDLDTNLAALWEGTILPHILAVAGRLASGRAVVVRGEPVYDLPNNGIAAQLDLRVDTGSRIYQGRIEIDDDVDLGVKLNEVWSGDPEEVDDYQGPRVHMRTVTATVVTAPGAAVNVPEFKQPGFVELRQRRRSDPFDIAAPGSGQLVMHGLTLVRVFRKAKLRRRQATGGDGTDRTQVRR
jgi:hypothetical protein